jgi:hypothetical protein
MEINNSNKITPDQIRKLAEEVKKINKKIDLRNPLISESQKSIVSNILESSEPEKIIRDRHLDLDVLNKSKHVNHVNESEKDKWKRMMKYDVPNDETRNL